MIKFSKFFLLAAAGMSFFGSCSDDDTVVYPDPVVGEHISINPAEASVSSKGGKKSVMVTSIGDWTLSTEKENGYVTPSAVKGVDGDIVTFEVVANDKHEDQVFTYEFKSGNQTTNYTLTLLRKALDELTLTFDEGANNVSHAGGEVKVIVVSNNPWTLEGKSEFVTPSATQGEDGAEVTFTVQPNEGDAERVADFQFKNGEKVVDFKITQAAYAETIEPAKKDVKLSAAGNKKYTLAVKTNVDSRDLKAEIPAEAASWLEFKGALPATDGANAVFDVKMNRGEAVRTAAVTLKGVKGGSAVVNFTQLPEVILNTKALTVYVKTEAGVYPVEVNANVEYDVKVSEAGNGWCTFKNIEGKNINLEVSALAEGAEPRSCEVTLTEKNPADDVQPVTFKFVVSQRPQGLISQVADMRRSRAYFPVFKNQAPLNGLFSWTMEALVNIQEKRADGSLSTIMGIEGKSLFRMGDAGLPWNQLQYATGGSGNFTDSAAKLTELNKWYHVAFTFDFNTKQVCIYIDGELKMSANHSIAIADFGKAYGGYESDYNRSFWLGYAYNADRYFPGYMCEMRLWNKALTKEEINAKDHFYSVDPKSEGLVGYWKLNGPGEKSEIVTDYSVNENHMLGEIDVRTQGNIQVGKPGMNYVEVNLPE